MVDIATVVIACSVTGAAVAGAFGYAAIETQRQNERRQRIDTFVRRTSVSVDSRDVKAEMQRKKVNNRLKLLNEQKKLSQSRIGAVSALIQRAGLEMSITRFWAICIFLSLFGAFFSFVERLPPYAHPIVGFVAGILLPRMVLKIMAAKRAKAFTNDFISAIDVITRGLRGGQPPQECFRIIGRDVPDPCGQIFRQIIDETNAGLGLVVALERAHQRMPTQEFMFFCTVIAVQEQTGGNLADILSKISEVLRGRAQLREKIKALSGEARASSIIVGILPFAVAIILYVINYEYISLLWTTRMGEYFLAGAIAMMSLGVFVMNRMGKIDM